MNLSDQRFHPRFPFRAKGILTLMSQFVDVRIIDMSLSGARVVLDGTHDVQLRQHCALQIVTREGRELIKVETSVVHRIADRHIGLKLRNMTSAMEKSLLLICTQN